MKIFFTLLFVISLNFGSFAQTTILSQNWTNTSLISADDVWTGVPNIVGYRGDIATNPSAPFDPQAAQFLVDAVSTVIDVNQGRNDPNLFTSGGVTEFEITNPVVALQGSGTADAPNLVITIATTGLTNITVQYNLRDIDGSTDDAIQQYALQYRIGNSGDFTNISAGYVADASSGPNLATLVTPVNVTLPNAANDKPVVQIRILTINATGSDEWVGIDDILIQGTAALPVELTSFNANKSNTSTKISWQTASEQNNNFFSIERSQNGNDFDKIGEVKGNGNSIKTQNYSFVDASPVKGTNYYRLRQTDFDGKETVSKTVSVNFDGKAAKAKVYPTVVKDILTVELASDATTEILVRDITGRLILTKNTEGSFSTTLDLGTAANGLYFITVQSNQGLETVKVLKQ